MQFIGCEVRRKTGVPELGTSILAKCSESDHAASRLEVIRAHSDHAHVIEVIGLQAGNNDCRFLVGGDITH